MKKVLIVDDVPGWVRFHSNNIKYLDKDIQIDVAYNAKEALAKIECAIDEPYTTIFTDMQMESDFLPKMAGEWLIEQIQMLNKYYNNTKIVIVSASPNIERIAKHYNVLYCPKSIIRNSDIETYKRFIED